MKVNQSKNERIARVVAGLLMLKKSSGVKSKLFAMVPLVTGVTGYCPAKSKFLGIDELKSSKKCCSKQKAEDKAAEEKAKEEEKAAKAKQAEKQEAEEKATKEKQEAEMKDAQTV